MSALRALSPLQAFNGPGKGRPSASTIKNIFTGTDRGFVMAQEYLDPAKGKAYQGVEFSEPSALNMPVGTLINSRADPLEPRWNLLDYSGSYTGVEYTGPGWTSTTPGELAPDGSLAALVEFDGVSNGSQTNRILTPYTTGDTVSFVEYVKAGSHAIILFQATTDATTFDPLGVRVDLAAKTIIERPVVADSAVLLSYSLTELSNGWFKVEWSGYWTTDGTMNRGVASWAISGITSTARVPGSYYRGGSQIVNGPQQPYQPTTTYPVSWDVEVLTGTQPVDAARPTLRKRRSSGRYYLEALPGQSLPITFATPLGDNCTVVYSSNDGPVMLTGQTIGTTYNIAREGEFNAALFIINRDLTPKEASTVLGYTQRASEVEAVWEWPAVVDVPTLISRRSSETNVGTDPIVEFPPIPGYAGGVAGRKFGSTVAGPDGRIYFIPLSMPYVMIYNPLTGDVITTDYGLDMSALEKYASAALAPDGKIYCIPYQTDKILIIDTVNQTAVYETFGLTLDTPTGKWSNCIATPSGKIYGTPFQATEVLIVDTVAGTAVTTNFGLGAINGLVGGSIGMDGRVYCTPYAAARAIHIIDPSDDTCVATDMGATRTGINQYYQGTLAATGKIYCVPMNGTDFLVIDTINGTAERTTLGLGSEAFVGNGKWIGSVIGSDGKIYGVPSGSKNLLIIDPYTETAQVIIGAIPLGLSGWTNGTMGLDGKIYFSPANANSLMTLTTAGVYSPRLILDARLNKS